MARANLMLARGGWSATSVRAAAENALESFGGTFTCKGRDVLMPGDLAFDLSLIWYELGTNSSKYGAFGPGEGEVRLSWKLTRAGAERHLEVIWEDTSAPREVEKTGSGFGTRLIRQLVELKYQGEVSITESPHYRCALRLLLPQNDELSPAAAEANV
jgi:two-component sensor histidine kinase